MERIYLILSILVLFLLSSSQIDESNTFEYKNNSHLAIFPDSLVKRFDYKVFKILGNECDLTNHTCINFTQIPVIINKQKDLEELYFIMNDLEEIPSWLNSLTKLKVLDISGNKNIKSLDNLSGLVSLETLNMNDCLLTTLPESIYSFKKIKILGLEGNLFSVELKNRLKKELPNTKIYW